MKKTLKILCAVLLFFFASATMFACTNDQGNNGAENNNPNEAVESQIHVEYDYCIDVNLANYGLTAGTIFDGYRQEDSEGIKSKTLPTPKEKYADIFDGWYIEGTNNKVESLSNIQSSINLVARWNAEIKPDAGIYKDGVMSYNWETICEIWPDSVVEKYVENQYGRSEYVKEYVGTEGIRRYISYNNNVYFVMDDSIKSIGSEAFKNCSGLVSITIPDDLIYMDSSAFYGCSSLTQITIPESVYSLPGAMFYGCSSLVSINIPTIVENIGASAFENCTSLTKITIPNKVTSIGQYAFKNCSSLIEVNYNASGKLSSTSQIFYGAGSRGSGINFIIGDNLRRVEDYLLYSNGSIPYITNVKIGDNVTTIGEYAFYGCEFATIIIPSTITSIGEYAFYGCNITSNGILNCLTDVGSNAFCYCNGDISISIPDGTTRITYREFYYFRGLKSITIPNSVTSIGEGAFECSGITTINIPNSITEINRDTFKGSSLSSVTIPESVEIIREGAFYGCGNLTSLTIPKNLCQIQKGSFIYCRGLTEINFNARNCEVIEASNKYVYTYTGVFAGCGKSIEGIRFTIGNSVKIPDGLFRELYNVKELILEKGAYNIDNSGVYYCSDRLESVVVSSENTLYDSRNNCNAIIKISDNNLIVGCRNTIIPEGVISIDHRAFYECESLTSIIIPESVTSIGNYAFDDCTGLTLVTIDSPTIAELDSSLSALLDNATKVYVKDTINSVGTYITDDFALQAESDKAGYNLYLKKA